MAGLFPPLRDKVELKFPHTFEDALRIAQEKERKLKFQAQKDRNEREIIRGEGMHEGQIAPAAQNLPPMGNTQEETLSRLTCQLEPLNLHLMQQGEVPREVNFRGQHRQNQAYHYHNCGEDGHGMYNCPYPRREPRAPMPMNRPIYPRPPAYRPPTPNPQGMIPLVPTPIPIPAPPSTSTPPIPNLVVNVIRFEDRPKEKSIQFEVMHTIKRTRGDHEREQESEPKRNRCEGKETSREGESNKKPSDMGF